MNHVDPTPEMRLAAEVLVEVCSAMLGLTLQPRGSWSAFDPAHVAYGATIQLIREDGTWEIGLYGDEATCASLTCAMMALDEGCQPSADEIVDALGELLNVSAGKLKIRVEGREYGEIQTGVPNFLLGNDCRRMAPRKLPVTAQALTSPDFSGEIYFVWTDLTPLSLHDEISAWLTEDDATDKLSLARVRALLEELTELLGEHTCESAWTAIDDSMQLLLEIINEGHEQPQTVYKAIGRAIAQLAPALEPGAFNVEVASPRALLASGDDDPSAPPVERDDETLGVIAEFLDESDDGLERADGILMGLEQGQGVEEGINGLFRIFHSMKGVSGFLDFHDITELAHITETLLADARSKKITLTGGALDLVFESTDLMRSLLADVRRAVERGVALLAVPEVKHAVERIQYAIDHPEEAMAKSSAPRNEGRRTVAPTPSKRDKLKATLKVEVDLVTRLHQSVADLNQLQRRLRDGVDPSVLVELSRTTESLGEISALMSMVSLESVFQKMTRMVRDLAKKTEKLAQLVVSGEDTKVDRMIAEKISEPLVHMIRNAVDHGIEDEGARREAGKPLLGTVELSAYRTDEHVIIRIADDGKGLNRDWLVSKARAKGVIPDDGSVLSDREAFELIFAPGFSTAAAVTAISGRGVGMDVVKRNIEAIGGRIAITSEVGKGTTFELILPGGLREEPTLGATPASATAA